MQFAIIQEKNHTLNPYPETINLAVSSLTVRVTLLASESINMCIGN